MIEMDKIQKLYNNYEITLKNEKDSLNILVNQIGKSIIFESTFSNDYLEEKFKEKKSIKEIINEISALIDEDKIEIKDKLLIINKNDLTIELKLKISLDSLENRIEQQFKIITVICIISMICLICIFSLIMIYEINRNMNICDKNYIEFDNKLKDLNRKINEIENNNTAE